MGDLQGEVSRTRRQPAERVDGEIARDSRNFWDQSHYRMPIARLIENQIAIVLGEEAGS